MSQDSKPISIASITDNLHFKLTEAIADESTERTKRIDKFVALISEHPDQVTNRCPTHKWLQLANKHELDHLRQFLANWLRQRSNRITVGNCFAKFMLACEFEDDYRVDMVKAFIRDKKHNQMRLSHEYTDWFGRLDVKKAMNLDLYYLSSNPNEPLFDALRIDAALVVKEEIDRLHVEKTSDPSTWPLIRKLFSTLRAECNNPVPEGMAWKFLDVLKTRYQVDRWLSTDLEAQFQEWRYYFHRYTQEPQLPKRYTEILIEQFRSLIGEFYQLPKPEFCALLEESNTVLFLTNFKMQVDVANPIFTNAVVGQTKFSHLLQLLELTPKTRPLLLEMGLREAIVRKLNKIKLDPEKKLFQHAAAFFAAAGQVELELEKPLAEAAMLTVENLLFFYTKYCQNCEIMRDRCRQFIYSKLDSKETFKVVLNVGPFAEQFIVEWLRDVKTLTLANYRQRLRVSRSVDRRLMKHGSINVDVFLKKTFIGLEYSKETHEDFYERYVKRELTIMAVQNYDLHDLQDEVFRFVTDHYAGVVEPSCKCGFTLPLYRLAYCYQWANQHECQRFMKIFHKWLRVQFERESKPILWYEEIATVSDGAFRCFCEDALLDPARCKVLTPEEFEHLELMTEHRQYSVLRAHIQAHKSRLQDALEKPALKGQKRIKRI